MTPTPPTRRALLRGLGALGAAALVAPVARAAGWGTAPACATLDYTLGALPWGCTAIPQPRAALLAELPDAVAKLRAELGAPEKAGARFLKLCGAAAKEATAGVAPWVLPHVGVAAALFGRPDGWSAVMLGAQEAWEVDPVVVAGTDWLARYWIDGKPDRAARFYPQTLPVGPGARKTWKSRCGDTFAGTVHPTRQGEILVGDAPFAGPEGPGRVVAFQAADVDAGEMVAIHVKGFV